MAASQSEVHHSGLDPDLVDDAWYPLQAIRTAGEQGLWALALAGERLAGREGAAAGSMLDDLALQAARNRFLFSPGVVDGLVGAVAALPAEARGFEAVGAHQDPPACQAGVEIRWRPFATGDASVFGLPGARVEAGEVAWAPPHAGRYRAVLTAATDRGWAFQLRDLVCTDR